jgi:hypothetical protein
VPLLAMCCPGPVLMSMCSRVEAASGSLFDASCRCILCSSTCGACGSCEVRHSSRAAAWNGSDTGLVLPVQVELVCWVPVMVMHTALFGLASMAPQDVQSDLLLHLLFLGY